MMGGTFFDTFSAKEKYFFGERTKALTQVLEEWARGYSCTRPARVSLMSLLTAMTSPRLTVPDSLAGVKISFWIFAVDDLADEQKISLANLLTIAEQGYLSAKNGTGSNDESDELTAMLLEIRKDLSRFRLFEPLLEYWASNVRRLVEAMAQEYRYSLLFNTEGAQALPTLDECLGEGLYSIGARLWASVVWITQDDPSVLDQIELIDTATRHASRAIRLYNDFRTLDKEIAEGNINSVIVAYYKIMGSHEVTMEKGLAEARRYILQLADFFGQECYNTLEQIHTESRQVEETLSRLVAFHSYFYGHGKHDYGITSLADILTLLSAKSE